MLLQLEGVLEANPVIKNEVFVRLTYLLKVLVMVESDIESARN